MEQYKPNLYKVLFIATMQQEGEKMIKIVFKNGCICKWKRKEYTDYKYDGKCFIIIKNEQWVGIYNMDSIVSIIVK